MCAYNRVNGPYACENRHFMTDIAKRQWGLRGVILSDWFATHSTAHHVAEPLDGTSPPWTAAARRSPSRSGSACVVTNAGHQRARELSEQGTVLLKNRGGLRPLDRVVSLAVIGTAAQDEPVYTGGGCAAVVPSRPTTPLEGIRARQRREERRATSWVTAGSAESRA